MYAVFRTGGKQYRAAAGDKLTVERIDAAEGDTVEFDEVLLIGAGESVAVGRPLVDGGRVAARVLSQGKGQKIDIIKFRRRKNYLRHKGHRQPQTVIEITGISGGPAA